MTDSPSSDIWDAFSRPWLNAALAPQKLWQSINSGWSFGNVTINEQNSSAPQTEQAILAQESYGRQIGKLLDAVNALVVERADAKTNDAFIELTKLRKKVEKVKKDAAIGRIEQLRHDLELLRTSDDAVYRKNVEALRSLLKAIDV